MRQLYRSPDMKISGKLEVNITIALWFPGYVLRDRCRGTHAQAREHVTRHEAFDNRACTIGRAGLGVHTSELRGIAAPQWGVLADPPGQDPWKNDDRPCREWDRSPGAQVLTPLGPETSDQNAGKQDRV